MVYNNYFQSCYNNDRTQLLRINLYDKWCINFDTSLIEDRSIKSFKQEVLYNCELMYDSLRIFTPKLNLFFSGGTDSECIIRCFNELHIPINPIILVHTYAEEREETCNALKVCSELSITPSVFRINLHQVFSSGKLHHLGLRCQSSNLAVLQLLYVIEQMQEPAIVVDEIRLNFRCLDKNLINKRESDYQTWVYELRENWFDGIYDRFTHITHIPVIAHPLRYTPYSWAAMLITDDIQNIVFNNRGKATAVTTKNIMMSKEFNIINRQKTGIAAIRQYIPLFNKLKKDLNIFILPQEKIEIEYANLLSLLRVKNAI